MQILSSILLFVREKIGGKKDFFCVWLRFGCGEMGKTCWSLFGSGTCMGVPFLIRNMIEMRVALKLGNIFSPSHLHLPFLPLTEKGFSLKNFIIHPLLEYNFAKDSFSNWTKIPVTDKKKSFSSNEKRENLCLFYLTMETHKITFFHNDDTSLLCTENEWKFHVSLSSWLTRLHRGEKKVFFF